MQTKADWGCSNELCSSRLELHALELLIEESAALVFQILISEVCMIFKTQAEAE
jgi:hypothetical protein